MVLPRFWYVRDCDPSVSASFKADDVAVVGLAENWGTGQEIGLYEAELPKGSYALLRRLAHESGLENHRSQDSMPGMVSVAFGHLDDEANTNTMRGFNLDEVPPALDPLLGQAQAFVEATLAHPKHVLRGFGACLAPTFAVGEPFAFSLELEALGTEPSLFDNPFGGPGPHDTALRLRIERDLPDEKLRDRDVLELEVTPQDLVVEGGRPNSRRVTLSPGAKLHWHINKKALASPGRYRARCTVSLGFNQRLDVIWGTLTIDLGTFTVAAPKRQPRR